jgi:hypothetical protein
MHRHCARNLVRVRHGFAANQVLLSGHIRFKATATPKPPRADLQSIPQAIRELLPEPRKRDPNAPAKRRRSIWFYIAMSVSECSFSSPREFAKSVCSIAIVHLDRAREILRRETSPREETETNASGTASSTARGGCLETCPARRLQVQSGVPTIRHDHRASSGVSTPCAC